MPNIMVKVDCDPRPYEIDVGMTLAEIKKHEPKFFEFKAGEHEKIRMHKGCVIVSATQVFSDYSRARKHVSYLYCKARGQTLWLGFHRSAEDARRYIDDTLASGIKPAYQGCHQLSEGVLARFERRE